MITRGYDALGGGTPAAPRPRADGDTSTASARPGTPVPTTDGHGAMEAAPVRAVPGPTGTSGSDGPYPHPPAASGPRPPVSTSSHRAPWSQRLQRRWASVPTSIRAMRLELRAFLGGSGLPDEELDDLVLAASEAAANAVEHARPSTRPYFDVLTEVGEEWARIVVRDPGRWREPTAAGDRGRGLQMIGVLADATLTVGSRGTTLVLRSHPVAHG